VELWGWLVIRSKQAGGAQNLEAESQATRSDKGGNQQNSQTFHKKGFAP
jgi:hypothetical protein